MPILQTVLGFVWKRPWIIVILTLLVVAGVLKLRLRSSEAALAKEKTANAAMSAALKEQNQTVADWMNAAVAQTRRAEVAEKEASRLRTVTATRIERVLSEPVPKTCSAAVAWGAEFGARVGQEWEEAAP